jgi:copper homeostasis protein
LIDQGLTAMTVLVEACVDTADDAAAAERAGAGRVELCANLVEGGTTPSLGAIAETRARLAIPVFVIVRPRAGDFLYSAGELAVMRRDILAAKELGADGVVLGVLTPDGTVDEERTAELVALARPMAVTFHRAFDLTRDPLEALDAVARAGADRVLTSGGAATAEEGIPVLAALVRRAVGRPVVMAGGGITGERVGRIVRETGVREVHARAAGRVESAMHYRRASVAFGKPYVPDEYARSATDPERIRALVAACAGA